MGIYQSVIDEVVRRRRDIKRLALIAVVAAGYVAAFLAASAALYLHQLATPESENQASGGMYAFGDSLFFFGVFGVLALFPTGLALYLLRPVRFFWKVFPILSLLFAVSGLATAVVVALTSRFEHPPVIITLVSFIGILQMLSAPLFFLGFLLGALIAPAPRPRWIFFAAMAFEGVLILYLLYRFFLPLWLWR